MPARLRLSWGMKTLKLFLLSVLECLKFGRQAIRYALIFVSAFFRQRASLGFEMVALHSQLTIYKESIRQQRQPRPRFHPAFRLLWVRDLTGVWGSCRQEKLGVRATRRRKTRFPHARRRTPAAGPGNDMGD